MTVRIAFTDKTATFTQRGKNPLRGFIRVNGRTITGERSNDVFYTEGINASAHRS